MIFGRGLNEFSDIRLTEYLEFLNRRYITNALAEDTPILSPSQVIS